MAVAGSVGENLSLFGVVPVWVTEERLLPVKNSSFSFLLKFHLVTGLALLIPTVSGASTGPTSSAGETSAKQFVYFGTFTAEVSGGIFVAQLDPASGQLSPARVAAKAESPGFLAVDDLHRRLYALSQTTAAAGSPKGCVESFAIDPSSGGLTRLNRRITGGGPFCYLALDRTRSTLGAARYGDGNAVTFPVAASGEVQPVATEVQHEGSGPDRERQEKAHVHSINFSPDNRFAIVADLGIDEIRSYAFDAKTNALDPKPASTLHTPPGSGPRHFAFHPNGRFAYAVCEIDATVLSLRYDSEHGSLEQLQVSPLLPPNTAGEQRAAEVVVHPSGKFLYVSNRGYDALVVFAIDAHTGMLTYLQREHDGIAYPRNFAVDPSGRWLLCANRDSNSVTVYAIDQNIGQLSRTGNKVDIPQPVCVRFYSAP